MKTAARGITRSSAGVLAACFLLVCGARSVTAADRALIIGINTYQHPGISLEGAVNDARRMHRFARTEWGYEEGGIRLLLDGDATREAIVESIGTWLVAGSREGDRVLLYFSGHGTQAFDDGGDEADGLDEALVPTDFAIDPVTRSMSKLLLDDELQSLLEGLVGRRLTIIIDSCHSGTATRDFGTGLSSASRTPAAIGARLLPGRAQRAYAAHRGEVPLIERRPDMMVWSAVSAGQEAFESLRDGRRSGIFTSAFIDGVERGLADRNGNGEVSNAELLDYVREKSSQWCSANTVCRLGMTPSLEAPRELLAHSTDWAASPFPTAQASAGTTAAAAPASAGPQAQLASIATGTLSHGNDAGVVLEVLPAPRVQLGDTVRFRVHSARPGFLVLLDINARNELTQLFPNRFGDDAERSNRIDADRAVTIPDAFYGFEFQAREPIGTGTLLAIVTEDDVGLDDLLERHRDLVVVERAADYLLDLAERLRETWREERFNRALRWSMTETSYQITAR